MNNQCLTVSIIEACTILGVSRQTGYKLAKQDRFPGLLKIGDTYKVSTLAISGLLNRKLDDYQKADDLITERRDTLKKMRKEPYMPHVRFSQFCARCGYRWDAYRDNPSQCPNCKSFDFKNPPKTPEQKLFTQIFGSDKFPSPYKLNGNIQEAITFIKETLGQRMWRVLELRFGFADGRVKTLEEVGKEYQVTRERIRQIEAKALRMLRHPSRSKILKAYIE
jgi:DNA-directed RNA polymerase sigma subunit (sigma70/sigma32)